MQLYCVSPYRIQWDDDNDLLIVADSEEHAREIACAAQKASYRKELYNDPRTTVEPLDISKIGIVYTSFQHG